MDFQNLTAHSLTAGCLGCHLCHQLINNRVCMSTPSVQEKPRDVKPSSAQDDTSGQDYIYIGRLTAVLISWLALKNPVKKQTK